MNKAQEKRLKVLLQKVDDPEDMELRGLSYSEAIEFLTLRGMPRAEAKLLIDISRLGFRDDEVIDESSP